MKRVLTVAIAGLLLAPVLAAADGLPLTGVYAGDGVTAADGAYRYLTFPGGRNTVVARVRTNGGSVARYRTVDGRFTVPVVASDGSGSGLSTDDRTLVLIRPRVGLGQKRTHLAVLDAQRLTITKRINLTGDFSFDALSPDGTTAYVVQYLALSRHNFDPTEYKVRSLDTVTGKLHPAPIVDPREPDEKMGGLPITRAMSPDTRWAYTLYSGGEHPFIHALDTTGRTARCIDLDALTARDDLFQLRLRVAGDGRQLEVVKGTTPVQVVDTRTWTVRDTRPAAKPAPKSTPPHDDGPTVWPWAVALGLLALLAASSLRPLARATRAR
jgi:hypothetical protein